MKGITSDLHNKYYLISSLSVVILILVSVSFSILYLIIDFGILAISFWFILYYLIIQMLFFPIFKARDVLLVMRRPRYQFITKNFFYISFVLVNLLLFGAVFLFYDELYLVVIFSVILLSILYLFLYSYLQFPVKDIIPSAGQGIISLQCRENDSSVISVLNKINHDETHKRATAERNVLKVLEGDCETAVGAHATIEGNKITLEAELFSLDGMQRFYEKGSSEIENSRELGKEIGQILKEKSNNSYKK